MPNPKTSALTDTAAGAEAAAGSGSASSRVDAESTENVQRKRRRLERRALQKAQTSLGTNEGEVDRPAPSPPTEQPNSRAEKREQRRAKRSGTGGEPFERDDDEAEVEDSESPEPSEVGELLLAGDEEEGSAGQAIAAETNSPPPVEKVFSSPVRCSVLGEKLQAERLSRALGQSFAAAGWSFASVANGAELLVLSPHAELDDIPRATKAVCLIGDGSRPLAEDVPRVRSARALGAAFVPTQQLLSRYGERALDGEGALAEFDASLIAPAVRDVVFAAKNVVLHAPANTPSPKDLAETLARSADVSQLLSMLDWPGKSPPGCLGITFSATVVEPFIDGNIGLPGASGRDSMPFEVPFDWRANRGARASNALYGLEVVSNVLVYWFLRANRVPIKRAPHIEALLKQKGITASGLLAGASVIILDFLRAKLTLPESAWGLAAVRRRAAALEVFLLCCKLATQRRIRFDESACGPVFHELLQLLEHLRGPGVPRPGSAAGVDLSMGMIGLALPLRKTAYGARLLQDAIESLHLCQLEAGMSSDGVWEEGIVQQIGVLGSLRILARDLKVANISARPIAETMVKLARFIDIAVSEGHYPALAEMPPGDGRRTLAMAEAVLRGNGASAKRSSDGYFPDGGYFISRSAKSERKPSSHLLLVARTGARGGMSLTFSVAGSPVLIGGGTLAKTASREIRRAALDDPGSHNAIRVNKFSHRREKNLGVSAVRLVGNWQERQWTAARLINEAFAPAAISRTVIHLKTAPAVLVVDELNSPEKESNFEQFWHLSPELQSHGPPLFFSTRKGGILSVAFDSDAPPEVQRGDHGLIGWTTAADRKVVPNPYIVRAKTTTSGLMASFFCWGSDHVSATIDLKGVPNGWRLTLAGEGPKAGFAFAQGNLTAIA